MPAFSGVFALLYVHLGLVFSSSFLIRAPRQRHCRHTVPQPLRAKRHKMSKRRPHRLRIPAGGPSPPSSKLERHVTPACVRVGAMDSRVDHRAGIAGCEPAASCKPSVQVCWRSRDSCAENQAAPTVQLILELASFANICAELHQLRAPCLPCWFTGKGRVDGRRVDLTLSELGQPFWLGRSTIPRVARTPEKRVDLTLGPDLFFSGLPQVALRKGRGHGPSHFWGPTTPEPGLAPPWLNMDFPPFAGRA